MRATGRMPRPLPMRNVTNNSPVQRVIVANAQERLLIAKQAGVYDLTKLTARVMARRTQHPVWGHDRIMVYIKLRSEFIMGDFMTGEPVERQENLQFKTAFREDRDPNRPTAEFRFDQEIDKRGLRSDFVEGKKIEAKMEKVDSLEMDVEEDEFVQHRLDNVIDLGELIVEHYLAWSDKGFSRKKRDDDRALRRQSERVAKDYGVAVRSVFGEKLPERQEMSVQEKYNMIRKRTRAWETVDGKRVRTGSM